MTRSEILQKLTDQAALGLTAWAEGRGDWRQGHSSVEERIAVMLVVRHRLKRWQRFGAASPSYKSVCLAPKQFSCWNPSTTDKNHLMLMAMAAQEAQGQPLTDALVNETIWLAGGIISNIIQDTIGGADHYYAPKAMVPPGRVPSWAVRDGRALPALAIVGDQQFFQLA